MKTICVACVVGARPNFIKMAALVHELRRRPRYSGQLIHTGQHFSPEMSQTFFRDLEMTEPDYNLDAAGGTQTEQTAEIMRRLEPVLGEVRPDLVLVVGDVNSSLAAALVASKMGIPIAHVEAGLRSFDRSMPEEINRLVTDVLSRYLFATEPSGVRNLIAEGFSEDRIFLVGNVMIDTLLRFREKAERADVLERFGFTAGAYAVLTLHRPSNVDNPEQLRGLLRALSELSRRIPVVFPVHPRTRQRMDALGMRDQLLRLLPPLGYLDFLRLMAEARLVLTDSGGIQEETTILGVPCLTLRENTERPATIETGTNRLAGTDPDRVLELALRVLDAPTTSAVVPEMWDGQAASRIFDVLDRSV
jgi:UDP-N-acetylglucosamine 2-epimerase (non-hydrolysing)